LTRRLSALPDELRKVATSILDGMTDLEKSRTQVSSVMEDALDTLSKAAFLAAGSELGDEETRKMEKEEREAAYEERVSTLGEALDTIEEAVRSRAPMPETAEAPEAGVSAISTEGEAPPVSAKPDGDESEATGKRVFPDPKKHTVAKIWTTKNGLLHLKTETKGVKDGEVTLIGNKAKLLRLLAYRYKEKDGVSLIELVNDVYASKMKAIGDGSLPKEVMKSLLANVRSLVTDFRKKLTKHGMNKEILSLFGRTEKGHAKTWLRVARLFDQDDHGLDEFDLPQDLQ